jgi:hypothetical protein
LSFEARQALITDLETVRNSRVLSYLTSDRATFPQGVPGFSTQLSNDSQPFVLRLLDELGHPDKLDLFLYTRGGATEAIWPLVNALREHTNRLTVLVPFRAHSGGTLLSLGADEIVMCSGAELGPIDPTTGNQFNPRDPNNPSNQFGISVEDVVAYFQLARERAGIEDEAHRAEVFRQLTSEVHPLALGNVQRVYMLIRRIAERLLALHLGEDQKDAIKRIAGGLTQEFYSHTHAISFKEASELFGDWVRTPTEAEAPVLARLYESYAETFGLGDTFSLPEYMGDQPTRDLHVLGALIETGASSYAYSTEMTVIQRPNLPPGFQVQVPPGQPIPMVDWASRAYEQSITRMGWRKNANGE